MSSQHLTSVDDLPFHQHAKPFALPVTSDSHFNDGYFWGTYAADRYVAFGLRVHPNNNVMDGFAGIVYGSEQRDARFSRALRPNYDQLEAGPLRVDVLEPMQRHQLTLAANPTGVTAELEFTRRAGPVVESEGQEYRYGRLVSDIQRYCLVCRAQGTVTVDGDTIAVDSWHAQRDHSWGIRSSMGPRVPIKGIGEESSHFERRALRLWVPFEVDGHCGFFHTHEDTDGRPLDFEGELVYDDGRTVELASLHHELEYDPGTKRLRGGTFVLRDRDDEVHEYVLERVAYPAHGQGFGYAAGWQDGGHHGAWRGADHIEHDRFDVSAFPPAGPEAVPAKRRIGGVEYSCAIRTADGATGMANVEHVYYGPYARYGFN